MCAFRQSEELSPAYAFLASAADSSYIAGIVLRVLLAEKRQGNALGHLRRGDRRSPLYTAPLLANRM